MLSSFRKLGPGVRIGDLVGVCLGTFAHSLARLTCTQSGRCRGPMHHTGNAAFTFFIPCGVVNGVVLLPGHAPVVGGMNRFQNGLV